VITLTKEKHERIDQYEGNHVPNLLHQGCESNAPLVWIFDLDSAKDNPDGINWGFQIPHECTFGLAHSPALH
jgi:hypothetical protein